MSEAGAATVTWLTSADMQLVTGVWQDADALDAAVVDMYLAAAREACESYAPPLPAPEPGGVVTIPPGWQIAQAMQARNIASAAMASPGGDFDGGGYGLTAHPLDWMVRQLLRPRQAVGAIL